MITLAGLCAGSFMAVVVMRSISGQSFLGARSRCDACGQTLRIQDLIPLASFIILKGRCAHCGRAISWLHPVMESAASAIALSAAVLLPDELVVQGLLLGWTLLLLAGFDAVAFLLPLPLTFLILLGGVAEGAWLGQNEVVARLLGATIAALSLGGVALGFRVLRGKDGLGGGDVILFAAGGAWLGPLALPWVALLAATSALMFAGVRAIIVRAPLAGNDRLPFGCFLALAIWIIFLVQRGT